MNGGKRGALARACTATGMLPLLARARSFMRTDVRILAYHRILDVCEHDFDFDGELVSATSAQFREQMEWVCRRFHPMRFSDLIKLDDAGRKPPGNALVVTFDDGYDDNYRVAFPILRELGIPATFFVSTGHIDSGMPYLYDWLVHMVLTSKAAEVDIPELRLQAGMPQDRPLRRQLATELLDRMKWLDDDMQVRIIERLQIQWSMPLSPHPDCRPMNWDQLREMRDAGMEIGSHGVRHRMLARLPKNDMIAEIAMSKAALERELRVVVEALSYPVGGLNAYSDEVIAALRSYGYRVGCTYINGSNTSPVVDVFKLRRLPVERCFDEGWFRGMVVWPEVFGHPTPMRVV